MAEIQDGKQLRAWLDGQPRAVAVAIAVRAALRVFPLLDRDSREDAPAALILSTCRAMATALVVGTWPTRAVEVKAAADAAYAAAADAHAADAHAAAAYAAAAAADAAAAYTDSTAAAAYAAADTAAADADFATGINLWKYTADDISFIDRSSSAEILCRMPLWPEEMPVEIRDLWRDLSARLLAEGEDWQVWTRWYEDRLAGEAGGRPLIEQLEVDRVLVPTADDWKEGPGRVNPILKALEEKYRAPAEIPGQHPAILEVEFGADGLLHRKPATAPETRDEDQRARLEEAWRALKGLLERLLALNPQGRGLGGILAAYGDALGDGFDAMRVVELGTYGREMQEAAGRADEILIGAGAAQLAALAASHGLFIRQLPVWRAYLADAEGDEPNPAATEKAVGVLRMTGQFSQLMGADVVDTANRLADAAWSLTAGPEDRLSGPLGVEAVRSTENLLAGLFERVYAAVKAVGKVAGDEALKGFGIGVRTVVAAITIGTSAEVLGLTEALGGRLAWLKPVVDLLKKAIASN